MLYLISIFDVEIRTNNQENFYIYVYTYMYIYIYIYIYIYMCHFKIQCIIHKTYINLYNTKYKS